jgi:hypothetical protein
VSELPNYNQKQFALDLVKSGGDLVEIALNLVQCGDSWHRDALEMVQMWWKKW